MKKLFALLQLNTNKLIFIANLLSIFMLSVTVPILYTYRSDYQAQQTDLLSLLLWFTEHHYLGLIMLFVCVLLAILCIKPLNFIGITPKAIRTYSIGLFVLSIIYSVLVFFVKKQCYLCGVTLV